MQQPEYAGTFLRPRRSKTWHSFFASRADLLAFSAALRAEFPNLSFIAHDYWAEFRPPEPKDEDRPPTPDPKGAYPREFDSFFDAATQHIRAWVRPARWKPRWSEPYGNGDRYILNGVRAFLSYRRETYSHFDGHGRGLDCFDEPPQPGNDRDMVIYDGTSTLWGAWQPEDAEGARFVRRAFAIAGKLARDDFIRCERGTGRPLSRSAEHHKGLMRAGLDAIRWANSRRHNYFSDHRHWFKPGDYPLTAADFAHLRRRPANVRVPA